MQSNHWHQDKMGDGMLSKNPGSDTVHLAALTLLQGVFAATVFAPFFFMCLTSAPAQSSAGEGIATSHFELSAG